MQYECTSPTHTGERSTRRELLTVKKVNFLEIGVNAKTLKTRTDSWLCPTCLVRDEHWRKPAYDAPGMRDRDESSLLTPIANHGSVTPSGTDTADA